MFNKLIFETAVEFLDAVKNGVIPREVYLVHDDGPVRLSGKGSEAFGFCNVDWSAITTEALKRAGINVHFT